jgi:hypothetical protein
VLKFLWYLHTIELLKYLFIVDKKYADNALLGINTTRETVLADSIRVTNDETPEMSDADLVALKKAAPLIKEMLIAVDKELYARAKQSFAP